MFGAHSTYNANISAVVSNLWLLRAKVKKTMGVYIAQ